MGRNKSMKFFSVQLFFCAATIAKVSLLECYTCEFSYQPIDNKPDSWCADKNLVSDQFKDKVKQCAAWEKYCATEVQTINTAFTAIARGCADVPNDDRICTSSGFGTDVVTCRDYCQSDRCNSNYKVVFYEDVMQSRFTGWSKVLKEEQKFNEETNIHLDL